MLQPEVLNVEVMKELLAAQMTALTQQIKDSEQRVIQHAEQKLVQVKEDVEDLKKQIKAKDIEINELRRSQDKEKRLRNILIYDIPENETDGRDLRIKIMKLILEECKVNISGGIDFVYRIGKKNSTKTRPILLSLTSLDLKMEIMWSKKNNNSKLGVSDDFCKEVSDERKRLLPLVKTLRSLNLKNVHLRYDKIFINGVQHDEATCKKMIEDSTLPSTIETSLIFKEPTAPAPATKDSTTLPSTYATSSIFKDPLAASDFKDSTVKRSRSEITPEKTPNAKIKTKIIGSNTNSNAGTRSNPIKEALKKQMLAGGRKQSISE